MIRRGSRAPRATLTSQGQITVPKAVRDALGVAAGEQVEFEPHGDVFVFRVRRPSSVLDFAGIAEAAAPRLPATADDLDRVLEQQGVRNAIAREAHARRPRRARR